MPQWNSDRLKNYHIKAYSNQTKTWKACGKLLNQSVSEWVREVLDSVVLGNIKPNFEKARMVRGRNPDREEIAESFQFRVTQWQIDEWTQCADSEGLSIGEWCRQCLDYMSKYQFMLDLRKVI